MARRDYAGNAVPTTLAGNINATDLTISIANATGWPSGGAAGKFYVTINRDGSTEERVLIESRTGTTLTVDSTSDRGVDDTSAASHGTGETIEHTFSSADADEANRHINDVAQDDHTQYLNNARHDIEGRHTFGGALGTPVAASDIGTGASAGAGNNPAREDHVHQIGAGAIDDSAMFAAGVVNAAAIATGAVGSDEIAADAVGASEIAAGAVGNAELAVDAVTQDKMANDSVGAAEIIAGAVGAAEVADGVLTQAKMSAGYRLTFAGPNAPGSPSEGDQWYETDTDRVWIYNGSSWTLIGGKVPFCDLTQSSAQAFANATSSPVGWTSETEDADNFHSLVGDTATITPNIAGVYKFTFSVCLDEDVAEGHLRGLFNGAEIMRGADVTDINSGLGTGLGTISFDKRCNGSTDQAHCNVYVEGTDGVQTTPSLCKASAVWLGP